MTTVGAFPIVRGSGTIEKFLDRVTEQSRPGTEFKWRNWLRSSSLKSSNFDDIPDFARFVGIADQEGPTDNWDKLRSRENQRTVLLTLLQQAYAAPLEFLGIDSASEEYRPRLIDWLKTQTGADEARSALAVDTMIRAFDRALGRTPVASSQAGNSGPVRVPARAASKPTSPSTARPVTRSQPQPQKPAVIQPPTPQIAIQVNVSPGMSAEEIDRVFASMARHFYGLGAE